MAAAEAAGKAGGEAVAAVKRKQSQLVGAVGADWGAFALRRCLLVKEEYIRGCTHTRARPCVLNVTLCDTRALFPKQTFLL